MLPFIWRIKILERNHCSLTLSLECSSDNARRCRACSQNRSRSLPVKHFGGSTCSHVTKQPPIFIRLITFSNPYTTNHNIRCILTKLALNPFSPSLSVIHVPYYAQQLCNSFSSVKFYVLSFVADVIYFGCKLQRKTCFKF